MTDRIKKLAQGEINLLGVVSIGVTLVLSVGGGYFLQSQRTDEKIGTVSERTARLEEAVETIKKDNAETRNDIKEFLRELNARKR